jgi:methylated-DNA-[protein]-cysteine S-methyltransferase
MERVCRAWVESPIGWLEIAADDAGVTAVDFIDGPARRPAEREGSGFAEACRVQLEEYFSGRRRVFDVPLHLRGTPFQKKAWEALLAVGFGQTVTYKDIAAAVGNPNSTRAVGGANHRNPVSIIVPCHRVIGRDGRLTGYGGGLWRKEWLLAHERRHAGY